MSDKRTFILAHDEARRRAVAWVAQAPAGHVVTVQEPTRNLEQNALMWVLLQAFSDQLKWPVNGAMVKLDAEGKEIPSKKVTCKYDGKPIPPEFAMGARDGFGGNAATAAFEVNT